MFRPMLFLASGLSLLITLGCDPAVQSRPKTEQALSVRVEPARLEDLVESLQLPGTVTSLAQVEVAARLLARVLEVPVEAGDVVSAHRLLVRLESRELQAAMSKVDAAAGELAMIREETAANLRVARAQIDGAESSAALAESTFQRFQALIEKQAVSQQEFDEVRARREAARAAVTVAQESLRAAQARQRQLDSRQAQIEADRENAATYLQFAEIRSPFPGVVVERLVDPGDLASPGTPLLIVEKQQYRFEAAVEESLLAELSIGRELDVRLDSSEAVVPGRVSQIAPAADPSTRTTLVKINLANHPGLRSGVFGRVTIPGPSRTRLTVSNRALVERGQLSGVFVVENGRALFRVIRIGRVMGERTAVLSGLGPESSVILEPSSEVHDGSRVTIVAGRESAS